MEQIEKQFQIVSVKTNFMMIQLMQIVNNVTLNVKPVVAPVQIVLLVKV
jgi:hypothetical protein